MGDNMYKLNKNVVYVKGAKNGALYDFSSGDVYSINTLSCKVVEKYISGIELSDREKEYYEILKSKNLVDDKYIVSKYNPSESPFQLDLAWLEITQECNCKCIHCYEGTNHKPLANSLTLLEWYSAIEQLKELNCKRIVIIGGEPCLHPNIEDIAEYAAKRIPNITIFSNGTCFSTKLKEIITHYNLKVKLSLYGHNEQVHDTITKHKGSFKRLTDSIKWFSENNIDVNIAIVIMKENEAYYNDLIQFTKSLKIKGYKIDVIREVFSGKQCEHLPLNKEIIRSVIRTKPEFRPITKETFDSAYFHNTCWFGKLAICQNGDILPCVFERTQILGNLKTSILKNILKTDNLSNCWNLSFEKIDKCKCCEFRFACKDCRPLATASKGKYSKNPRCTYNVYTGEWDDYER